ncbi:serine/threonine protein phosphatase [Aquamicrobium segne]|uniref:Serine/threonine protein phosphatase n=1 Tax=Aquamicrobium segne TaxID=469547 RepID=A0ABW0GW08_9HYPH
MSKDVTDSSRDMRAAEGVDAQLRLLAMNARLRISQEYLEKKPVWIKRYDVERRPLGKVLHSVFSPLLPVFLKSSHPAPGVLGAEREKRKINLFAAAGLPVVQVLFGEGAVLIFSDAGEVAQKRLDALRSISPAEHDKLLVRLAQGLGQAHHAGLCHGRPHPRDMFVQDSHVGFLDFEEEPEAVMPLAMAQARDLWLLFLQICTRAISPETPVQAFAAYRAIAPACVMAHLARLVRFFHHALLPLRLLPQKMLGKDGLYAVQATSFLKTALDAIPASASSLHATGHERPRG